MKRTIFFIGILLVTITTSSLLSSCNSCSDRRARDVSSLPGLYEGEATIILPDHVKAMLKPDANGKTLVPEGPIPCKIRITADTSKNVTLQLVDFTMPVRGITVDPAKSKVIETDTTFNLEGGGKVTAGQQTISYTHKGKIQNDNLDLDITVTVIPMIVEPKIVFKGKKKEIIVLLSMKSKHWHESCRGKREFSSVSPAKTLQAL